MRNGILAAMIVAMTLTACIEPDGKWDPMKWSHPKYETTKVDGTSYYMVPVEGGRYGFRCMNYVPWLSAPQFEVDGEQIHAWQDTEMEDDYWHHYHNEWCRVDAVKDSVIVTFSANSGRARKAFVEVTAGDIFDRFRFIQRSALYTEQAAQ